MEPKIEIHKRGLETRLKSLHKWNIPDSEKSDLLKFLEQLELGRVNKGVRITEARRCKYLDMLRAPLEFLNKPSHDLTVENIEHFEKALANGTIQSNRGTSYSHASKVDMRRALKIYLRWKMGLQKAADLVGWLDTRGIVKTPDFLRETDVERLYLNRNLNVNSNNENLANSNDNGRIAQYLIAVILLWKLIKIYFIIFLLWVI